MTPKVAGDEPLRPVTPAMFHILLTLIDGERHGYSIMHEIERRPGAGPRIGPGTLYRSIKHLLEAGMIVESEVRPDPAFDDQRRRYYQITDLGRRVAEMEARRLEQLVGIAKLKHLLQAESGMVSEGGL